MNKNKNIEKLKKQYKITDEQNKNIEKLKSDIEKI